MTAPYLEVKDVEKRFGGLAALAGLSFAAEAGRITCLVGPNGAGKTTIFNVITGFVRPDRGSVRFRDKSLDGLKPQAVVDAGIARTFQNLRLFADLTVLDNVMLGLPGQFGEGPVGAVFRPLRTAREQARRRVEAAALLARVGLERRVRERVRNLSYGEQKLLSIARVLATGAEFLLLDEPASGLAADALEAMIELLFALKDAEKSLLVVEHNTRVVSRIADHVLFLHQGQLIAEGEPKAIVGDPKLAEIYFGGPI